MYITRSKQCIYALNDKRVCAKKNCCYKYLWISFWSDVMIFKGLLTPTTFTTFATTGIGISIVVEHSIDRFNLSVYFPF